MINTNQIGQLDKWAKWLLETRYGGSKGYTNFIMQNLIAIRDQILERAKIKEGDIVLDVGTGDGLLGFAALQKVGSNGKVILSDISDGALRHCQEFIDTHCLNENISILNASADNLSEIKDGSIDVIVDRAVLIYVQDKQKCFNEYFRVLKPGGRFSICETINRFGFIYKKERKTFRGFDMRPLPEIHSKIAAAFGSHDLETDPMLNFDERDLLNYSIASGFVDQLMTFDASMVRRKETWGWEAFIKRSMNPNSPTLESVMDSVLTHQERNTFENYMKPLLETESPILYNAGAYFVATKG